MADQDPNPQPVDPQPTPTPQPDPPASPPDPAPPVEPPVPARDWKDSRIAQLTAQVNRVKEELAAAKSKPVDPTPVPTPAPAIDDAEIERRADERAAIREFNRQCTDCQTAGRAQFTDFDNRVNNLRQLVDTNNADEVRRWNMFLSAAFETGNAPQLLHELGNDLNEAQRLLTLPPVQMAVALARRAPQRTAATDDPPPLPNPMRPVNDRGNSHARIEPDDPERSDQIKDINVWMTRRTAQAKERGIR